MRITLIVFMFFNNLGRANRTLIRGAGGNSRTSEEPGPRCHSLSQRSGIGVTNTGPIWPAAEPLARPNRSNLKRRGW
jgi:hypothetical protein